MNLYVLVVKRPLDGEALTWYFEYQSEYLVAKAEAHRAQATIVYDQADFVSDASEFTNWLYKEQ